MRGGGRGGGRGQKQEAEKEESYKAIKMPFPIPKPFTKNRTVLCLWFRSLAEVRVIVVIVGTRIVLTIARAAIMKKHGESGIFETLALLRTS